MLNEDAPMPNPIEGDATVDNPLSAFSARQSGNQTSAEAGVQLTSTTGKRSVNFVMSSSRTTAGDGVIK